MPSRGAVTGAWAPVWSLMKERVAVAGAGPEVDCGLGRALAVAMRRAAMVAMVVRMVIFDFLVMVVVLWSCLSD